MPPTAGTSIFICPPCASTTRLAISTPSPVPRCFAAEGHDTSAVYHAEREKVQLDAEFAALAFEIGLTEPQLSLGAKVVVSITHVAMMEESHAATPEALVARKQVYESHYLTASL